MDATNLQIVLARQPVGWVLEGRIRYREAIAQGLESARQAFIGMPRGAHLGKQLVKPT